MSFASLAALPTALGHRAKRAAISSPLRRCWPAQAGNHPSTSSKLDRAPTLVAVSAVRAVDPVQDEEDLLATACATYAVLLAAHARGLAGYWRTPGVLRSDAGLRAVAIPPEERFVALVHLGWPRQHKEPPERAPLADVVSYLG